MSIRSFLSTAGSPTSYKTDEDEAVETLKPDTPLDSEGESTVDLTKSACATPSNQTDQAPVDKASSARRVTAFPSLLPDKRDPTQIEKTVSLNDSTKIRLKTTYKVAPGDIQVHVDNRRHLSKIFIELETPVVIVKDNGKSKKGKGPVTKTHVCLLCLELGVEGYLYSKVETNQQNHLTTSHVGSKINFYRIKELLHKSASVYGSDPAAGVQLTLDLLSRKSEDPFQSYVQHMVRAVIKAGLSPTFLQDKEFRNAMQAAREVPHGLSMDIGRKAAHDEIMKQYDDLYRTFFLAIRSARCLSWSIVCDGWDMGKKHKILGATAVVLLEGEAGLEQRKFPLIFRSLVGKSSMDEDTDTYGEIKTLSSAEDMADLIVDRLESRGNTFGASMTYLKFTGAKGDGAANAVKCTKLLNKKAVLAKTIEKELPSSMHLSEHRCLAHNLGLAIKGSLGFLSASEDEDEDHNDDTVAKKSEIPLGPPQTVLRIMTKLRAVVGAATEAKAWAELVNAAAISSLSEPTAVHLDMKVRWLSYFNMLTGFLRNQDQFRSVTKGNLAFSKDELRFLQEQEALLQPLVDATRFMETSRFPVTPFVLPLLFSLLAKYKAIDSADPSSPMFSLSHLPDVARSKVGLATDAPEKLEESTFFVGKVAMKVGAMCEDARAFAASLQRHLYFRLVKDRKNVNALELLAARCDPFGCVTFSTWAKNFDLQSKVTTLATNVLADNTGAKADEKVEQAEPSEASASKKLRLVDPDAVSVSVCSSSSSHGSRPTPIKSLLKCSHASTFEIEMKEFTEECAVLVPEALGQPTMLSIAHVIDAANKLSPLVFWTPPRRERFPNIFRIAAIALGHASHTCLQESVFSPANDTLSSRRRRLVESQDFLEALVILRYYNNCQ
jgi:hypothetical protein